MTNNLLTFPGNLGWMGLAVRRDPTGSWRIGRLAFGHGSPASAAVALQDAGDEDDSRPVRHPAEIEVAPDFEDWISILQAFAAGQPVDLRHLPLDLDYLGDFGRRVIGACRELAWGQTTTYGELARQVGSPAASRAVGAVMARNRHPLIVPCHRVMASDGSLRGFSAAGGLPMKKRLLENETPIICSGKSIERTWP